MQISRKCNGWMFRRIAVIFLIIIICVTQSHGETVRGEVTYVSATAIYVNLGTADGLQIGDKLYAVAKDSTKLVVTYLSDHTAACHALDGEGTLKIHDAVTVVVENHTPTGEYELTMAEPLAEPADETSDVAPNLGEARNQINGGISFELWSYDSPDNSVDYLEPSVRIRTRISRLGGSHWELALHVRSTVSYPQSNWFPEEAGTTSYRLYEAALEYENAESRVEMSFGRVGAGHLRGVGYLDGGMVGYRLSESFSLGAVSGVEANTYSADFTGDVSKHGFYAEYESGSASGRRVSTTLAIMGSYVRQELDREYAYHQLSLSTGKSWTYFQSAEIDINRGWRKEKESSSATLSNFVMNTRFAMSRNLSVNLAYDARRNYYSYETRSVPDSLFDVSTRQGARFGLNIRPLSKIRCELGGGYRFAFERETESRSAWLMNSWSDAAKSGIMIGLRVRGFDSAYSRGLQETVSVSSRVLSVDVIGEVGWNSYRLNSDGQDLRSTFYRMDAGMQLTKRFSVHSQVEWSSGDISEGVRTAEVLRCEF